MLLLAAAGRRPLQYHSKSRCGSCKRASTGAAKGQAVRDRRFDAVPCYEPMEMLPKTVADAASGGRQCYRRPSPNLPAGNWRCYKLWAALLSTVLGVANNGIPHSYQRHRGSSFMDFAWRW